MAVEDVYERDIKEAGAYLARLEDDLEAATRTRDLAVSRGRGDDHDPLDQAWSNTADAAHALVKRLAAGVSRLRDQIKEMRVRQAEYLRYRAEEAAKKVEAV